jgi:ribosomal protein L21E
LELRIGRSMTATGTKNWTSALQSITNSYNNTYHSSIKMKPNEVTSENAAALFDYLNKKEKEKESRRETTTTLKVGDIVRIAIDPNKKKTFKKGYTPNWTAKFYRIKKINYGNRRPTFIVESENGDVLSRPFYKDELNFVMTNAEFEEERRIAFS